MRLHTRLLINAVSVAYALIFVCCASGQVTPGGSASTQDFANAPIPGARVPESVAESCPSCDASRIVVPTGTRLPLMLQYGMNTRTAKAGDSVYFTTVYPITQNDRIVIPTGSYLRGRIVEVKRPGRVKGRGEFRIVVESLTFSNGYTVPLNAGPSSADTNGEAGVDQKGKVVGRGSIGKDMTLVAGSTLGGTLLGSHLGMITGMSQRAIRTGAIAGTAGGLAIGLGIVLLTRGPEAELRRGTMVDIAFNRPVAFDGDRLPVADSSRAFSAPAPTPAEPNTRSHERQLNDLKKGRGPLSMLRLIPSFGR